MRKRMVKVWSLVIVGLMSVMPNIGAVGVQPHQPGEYPPNWNHQWNVIIPSMETQLDRIEDGVNHIDETVVYINETQIPGLESDHNLIQATVDANALLLIEINDKLDALINAPDGVLVPHVGDENETVFRDDFFGAGAESIMPWWVKTTTGGSSFNISGSWLEMRVLGAPDQGKAKMVNGANMYSSSDNLTFFARVRTPWGSYIGASWITIHIGFGVESNPNNVVFQFDDSEGFPNSPQWEFISNGTQIGTAPWNPGTIMDLEISVTEDRVTFYIDGVERANTTVHIPQALSHAGAFLRSNFSVGDTIQIEYIEAVGLRYK